MRPVITIKARICSTLLKAIEQSVYVNGLFGSLRGANAGLLALLAEEPHRFLYVL
jgi:hypothetical protein